MSGVKPRLFIGSSAEGLDVAYAIQENLEYDSEPTVWNQDVFKPSGFALSALVKAARANDRAVLVFSPDDILMLRGAEVRSARDNVVFEFGLFAGALGIDNCYFVVPRDAPALHLPTDMLGLIPLT